MLRTLVLVIVATFVAACSVPKRATLCDCNKLVDQLRGPEDLAVDEYTEAAAPRLIISVHASRLGDSHANDGIWALPFVGGTAAEPALALKVRDGDHECAVGAPHGIALDAPANGPARLFVINHQSCPAQISPCSCPQRKCRDSVERYRVERDHLEFERRFTDSQFVRLNDLDVSADGSEVYVSNRKTVLHGVGTDTNGDATWAVADRGLCFANGVGLDAKRQRLYVADSLQRTIRTYAIQHGSTPDKDTLVRRETILVGSGVDNILWSDADKTSFFVAAHPSFTWFALHAFKITDSPSEVYRVDHLDTAQPIVTPVFSDDGATISAASSAVPFGKRLYMGQVFDGGLLSCALPEQVRATQDGATNDTGLR